MPYCRFLLGMYDSRQNTFYQGWAMKEAYFFKFRGLIIICIFLTFSVKAFGLSLNDFKDCTNKFTDCFLLENKPEASFYLKRSDSTKIAVLFHGLTDSAYFLKDIAFTLYQSGYTVLVPLLSGHGTKPEDLHTVRYTDWIQDVEETLELAKSLSHEKVLVGGFSMGGVLATHAAQIVKWKEAIEGLILFGPAFQIKNSLGRAICKSSGGTIKTWARNKEGSTPYKYQQMSFRAVCELYNLGNLVKENSISIPTFMTLTEYDKIINSDEAFHFIASAGKADKMILVYSKDKREPSLSAQFFQSKEMTHTDLVFKEDLLTQRRNPHFHVMEEKLRLFLSRLH